jgi:glyoxylase-like metal-dependent hydrolase (beta-lactamase superfamily II)
VVLQRLPQVEPLLLANLTLPSFHPMAGDSCVVYAFVIHHPDGLVLVDTGVGTGHPGIEKLYQPVTKALSDALASAAHSLDDIATVVNTHLHFDHCGQNGLLAGKRVVVQDAEYQAAQASLYTVSEWAFPPGVEYERVTGETELLDGVRVVPTPGHTPGHQSVVIDSAEGAAIIAGQAAYAADEFAGRERGDEGGAWDAASYRDSLQRLRDLRPALVYFSHDQHLWTRAKEVS